MSSSNRKRNRHRKACLACRRRKSKCDCKRPVCETCERRQTEHVCIYDDLYPFQRSLRQYQSEPVSPNFPSFNLIHLPQMIAVGQALPRARLYSQNLSEFHKVMNPRPSNQLPSQKSKPLKGSLSEKNSPEIPEIKNPNEENDESTTKDENLNEDIELQRKREAVEKIKVKLKRRKK